jgi:CRISPR-associated endoribonuclease Cas6
LFPEVKRSNIDSITMNGNVTLFISSPKDEFILHLAQGLFSETCISINDQVFNIESVETLVEPEFKRQVKFICLSPVVTYTVELIDNKKHSIPCYPGTEKFAENIRNNLLRKHQLLYNKLPNDMSFRIDFCPEDLEKYSKGKLIQYRDIYIKAFNTPFNVTGSKELIRVGYQCGFGEKNSAGFGMVKAV